MSPSEDPRQAAQSADWLEPVPEQEGLRRYVETLRERMWIVIGVVVVVTLAAVIYVIAAPKQYDAEADVLVTPTTSTNTPLVGLPGLIPQSSDPTRDVETAARLITNVDVARRVKATLNSPDSTQTLLNEVS